MRTLFKFLGVFFALGFTNSYAQWNNNGDNYTNGKLGIGVQPSTSLDVRGDSRFSGATNGSQGMGDGFTHLPHSNGNNYIRGNTYLQTSGVINLYAENKTSVSGNFLDVETNSRFKGAANGRDVGDRFTHLPHSNGNNYIRGDTYLQTSGVLNLYAENKTSVSGNFFDVETYSRFKGAANGRDVGDGFTHLPHSNGNNYIRGNTFIDTQGEIRLMAQDKTTLMGGNVGIGTPNPGIYKLEVNGKIRAKEIKVETGWADFVFEKDYNLPTLKEVEDHIKSKGHLKDIPSAKEVEDNGIDLGEMNSKLLQKIEELTLYTINQQNQIEILKERNEEVEVLSKQLMKLQMAFDELK